MTLEPIVAPTLSDTATLTLLGASSLAIALVSFVFGPFVLVPTLAATNAMFFAMNAERPLRRVVIGHVNYYGVPSNYRALGTFHWEVSRIWHRSLQRRSQRGRWREGQRARFLERFSLPTPRIVHPWPNVRFFQRQTQGGSPVREIRSPGSVRGAR